MLLLEGYISNFTRARYYFLCVEFSDFYVNQSLTGQTILFFARDSTIAATEFWPSLSCQFKKNGCSPCFIVIMIDFWN
jgi:hypothetical protein